MMTLMISAASAFYNHIIPLLDVCDTLIWGSARSVPHDFDGQMVCHLMEDNQATIKIMKTGFSQKLGHFGRVNKVNLGSFSEALKKPYFHVPYVESEKQCGDIFTKAIAPIKWAPSLQLLRIEHDLPPSSGSIRKKKATTDTGEEPGGICTDVVRDTAGSLLCDPMIL